jgi:hypothetical protein
MLQYYNKASTTELRVLTIVIHSRIRDKVKCGLVVKVPGYRSRGPGFDSRRYQIF